MSEQHRVSTYAYNGFTVNIYQDQGTEEPDYGEEEIFLAAEKSSGYGGYRIGRRNVPDGARHLLWGEGPWNAFGSAIPGDAWEGEGREAYDLYQEWREQFDPSYVVYPIACWDAHGPGSFEIHEVATDEGPSEIEGYVYIRVPVGDLERLADTRDLEKMRDGIIEMYRQWCNGEVYTYDICDSDGDVVEDGSCGGIYGLAYAEAEARGDIDRWGDSCDKEVTLIVTRKNYTWEYRTVVVPLWVGRTGLLDWAKTNLDLDDDDTVQEYFVTDSPQLPLFPKAEEA